MDLKKQQMQIMHSMCQGELNILQKNLQKFVQESESSQKLLGKINSKGDILGLIAFDRYMSQLVTVLNMARKLNIHLQINNPHQVVTSTFSGNVCLEEESINQECVLKDFIELNNIKFEYGTMFSNEDSTSSGKVEMGKYCQMEHSNLYYCEENVNDRKSLTINNDLLKYEEIEKDSYIDGLMEVEHLLKVLLPTKSLDHIKINDVFEAYIVHVCDYKKLEFFICRMEDYKILYNFSTNRNFVPIPHPSLPSDDIFCMLERRDSASKECIWRAVKIPHEKYHKPKELLYLIDFGEIISLMEGCITYEAPQCYREIPPLGIKCILKGVENSFFKSTEKNQTKCEQILRENEFDKALFRVVQQKSNVLYVVLLDSFSDLIETLTVTNNNQLDPFLDDNLFIDKDLIALSNSVLYSLTPAREPILNISVKVGDDIQIMVTHIVSPISFYAIIQNDISFGRGVFSWHEHQISSSQKIISSPQINDIVLSQYYKDEYYYRAKIIDVDQKQERYKVFYVDFGNTEIVPLCSLAKCTKEQLEDPLRAVLFYLSNLSLISFDDEADSSKINYMQIRLKNALANVVVLILDQILNVKVVERRNDDLIVRLLDNQYDGIPNMLINMGIVKELKQRYY